MCQDIDTPDTAVWRAVRHRIGVYPCLSPCDGCKDPAGVMVGLTENIQACLRDFQTGTASMARKRHLASTARGLLCFCLMTLVTTGLIRSIRLIRGREETSRGWRDFCFYSAHRGFPWRTKKRGEQLANRKNRENLCSI